MVPRSINFDPTQFDQKILQEVKSEFGEGQVIQSEPITILYAQLTKGTN